MDKKIKETIENKFAVVLDDLLLPKALGTTVNPIIQGTDKRYIFYYLAKKQDNILLIYGSWKDTDDNGEPYKYTEELKGHFSKEDKENLLKSIKKPKRDVKKLKTVFDNATNEITEYVKNKKIEMFCAKNSQGDTLVPITNISGDFIGFQSINKEKRFVVSDTVKGAFSVIRLVNDSNLIYITEGFSTGASVAMALTSVTVISALSLSNIKKVASLLKEKFNDKSIIIVLDKPTNEQVSKVNESLKNLYTCVVPKIENGSDFNDLHNEKGLEEVRKQVLEHYSDDKNLKPIPIGYDEHSYYIYSPRKKQLLELSNRGDIKSFSLSLAPQKYWIKSFGNNGIMKDFEWQKATDTYIQLCIEKGFFDATTVRGSGIYEDKGRIFFNSGRDLYLVTDSGLETMEHCRLDSPYNYTMTCNKIGNMLNIKPLALKEREKLVEALFSFDWSHKNNAIIFAGWLVQSLYSGFSDWRSHIWITGSQSSGKSFIKNEVFEKIIPFRREMATLSTPMGTLQAFSPHALPFINEEFESTNRKNDEILDEIMEFHRVASTSRGEEKKKGTLSGQTKRYVIRHRYLQSSGIKDICRAPA